MKGILILFFILTIDSLWAQSLEEKICGKEFTSASLVSDWATDQLDYCKKNFCDRATTDKFAEMKAERIGSTYCATATCFKGDKKTEIRKCFYQVHTLLFKYKIELRENGGYEAKTISFPISTKDICYEDCKVIKNKILPLSFLSTRGLNRESCQKCFMARSEDLNTNKDIIDYPELGKIFYRGQTCYELCKDPDDQVLVDRKLTVECQKCAGINGFPGDIFRFFKTKNGTCYEVQNDTKIRATLPGACLPEKTSFTFFEKDRKPSFDTFFLGAKAPCLELDAQSGGRLYESQTDMANCYDEKSNINTGRNLPIEKSDQLDKPTPATQSSGVSPH